MKRQGRGSKRNNWDEGSGVLTAKRGCKDADPVYYANRTINVYYFHKSPKISA